MATCSCPEPVQLLLTCEHATNEVPPPYRRLFAGAAEVLQTHRGFDRYALDIAEEMAQSLQAPLMAATVCRLLVDCNRTPASRNLFSVYSRRLDRKERVRVLASWHTPHQEAVARTAAGMIAAGATVVHVAIHTFTPVLNGVTRTADLGMLYDPARPRERQLARCWLEELRRAAPPLRLRRNYPYRGKSNCLASILRARFSAESYLGLELELNQGTVAAMGTSTFAPLLVDTLAHSLPEVGAQREANR